MQKEVNLRLVVIGVDASYTRTGIGVAEDNELLLIRSIKFKGLEQKTEKRAKLRKRLKWYIKQYKPDMIIIERTRQFSQGQNPFIAMPMIKAGVQLLTVVIDVAFMYGVKVYSVDTRSWKSQVVGTSKPKNGDKKLPTMEFVESLGFEVNGDDDAADAGCMALYGFIPASKQKLRLEE